MTLRPLSVLRASSAALSVAIIAAASSSAVAAELPDVERAVVIAADQSTFGAIPALVPMEEGDDLESAPDVALELFGGPASAENSIWSTTALSFDAVDRLYVALLTVAVDDSTHACALRLYSDAGAPLGEVMPVTNPTEFSDGLWNSPCTALALLDQAVDAGFDFATYTWDSSDAQTTRTDALVYLEDGSTLAVDARTGAVDAATLAEGSSSYGGLRAVALTVGPAELVSPERSGRVAVLLGLYELAVVGVFFFDDGSMASGLGLSAASVVGAEMDSELTVWLLSTDTDPVRSEVVSGPVTQLFLLSDVSTAEQASASVPDDGLALLHDLSMTPRAASDVPLLPTALGAGVLVTDLGPFAAGGIAIERTEADTSNEPELADTGANDQAALTIALVAGALVVLGVAVVVVGAVRRRARGRRSSD